MLDQCRSEKGASTTTIIAVKREESFGSLLGRVYSQNPAETAIYLVVQQLNFNDIHSLFITISLPTDSIFKSTILVSGLSFIATILSILKETVCEAKLYSLFKGLT